MNLFHRNNSVMDSIRCDEPSYLIWKWHPKGIVGGENSRENSIRWGSSLRVRDGEAVIFVCSGGNGVNQEYIVGPFDDYLETKNLPVIANIIGLAYGGGTPFPAEVYFINLANLVQIRFGVPFFDVFDPRFPDFGVPVAVRGTISFKISDVDTFIKLHRLQNFSLEDFQKQIRDAVCRYVKDVVANVPAAHDIPVVQIESKTAQINDEIEYNIAARLKEQFAVEVSSVDIGAIEIDKSSSRYAQLMAVTKKLAAETVQAQTAVNIQQMQDKQRIEAENYQETLRIQREESQYAQRKQTQTTHFAAYQTESQTKVGVAGAEVLGKMSSSTATGSASRFDPAAMMAGMALGGAVGQNLASAVNRSMSGIGMAPANPVTPPPIPAPAYYVAKDGQPNGPFDMVVLKQMATVGQLTSSSLVWQAGMSAWEKAGSVGELSPLFTEMPPIPPME